MRFVRNVLGKLVGTRSMSSSDFRCALCAKCRGLNVVDEGLPDPETCGECGEPFRNIENLPTKEA